MMFGEFPVIDSEEFMHATGRPEFHDVQTITLGELIRDGVFTWDKIDWKSAAYSDTQYERLCTAFEDRFYFREIGITPIYAWLKKLRYKLVYELMPKYRPLYAQLDSGEYDPLQSGGEYGREREIASEFPETLLNGSDETYASSGNDKEYEIVRQDGVFTEKYAMYVELFRTMDAAILDELETLFSCLYSTNLNGL